MHGTFEDWYNRNDPDWTWFPGQVAQSGVHLLPDPESTDYLRVEESIGQIPIKQNHPDKPNTALEVHGVLWAGFKDLVVRPSLAEAQRLGMSHRDATLIDYKSTSLIASTPSRKGYALTPADLVVDLQANLYAIDECERRGLKSVPVRWVYFETKKVRRAAAVNLTIKYRDALTVLEPHAKLARELDTYTTVEDAPQNPRACGEFGGCSLHVSAGGPCNAQRSIGALVQARIKSKESTMPLDAKTKAKFAALQESKSNEEAEPSKPAKSKSKPANDEPKKPRKKRTTKKKADPNESAADVVLGLHGALAEASEVYDVELASLEKIKAEMFTAEADASAAQDAVDNIMGKIRDALTR